jgi:hypothetical protein
MNYFNNDWEDINERIRKIEAALSRLPITTASGGSGGGKIEWKQGYLIGDSSPAIGHFAGGGTAKDCIEFTDAGLQQDGEKTFSFKTYSSDISGLDGAYVLAIKLGSDYYAVIIDCEPPAGDEEEEE